MSKLFKVAANKFLITFILFLAWMMFFDQNDWLSQYKTRQNLQETKDNIAFLEKEIVVMESKYEALNNDPSALEKFAREKYRMKRANEDLYIIEQ